MKIFLESSPWSAFVCSRYPLGRLSFSVPVLGEGKRQRFGERLLLSPFLLMRVIAILHVKSVDIIEKIEAKGKRDYRETIRQPAPLYAL